MTGHCANGHHDDCSDSHEDKGVCACPCHLFLKDDVGIPCS